MLSETRQCLWGAGDALGMGQGSRLCKRAVQADASAINLAALEDVTSQSSAGLPCWVAQINCLPEGQLAHHWLLFSKSPFSRRGWTSPLEGVLRALTSVL